MCGIVGVANINEPQKVSEDILLRMLTAIGHRGPDGFGIYQHDWVGMGSARLSIIDLSGGDQPIGNEDDSIWVVFNGEIFNYVELRPELERRGHHFKTKSDTEIIVHMFEDFGPGCLNFFNGQFAIALWDERNQALFLARDRVGIRPVFYTIVDNQLVFGSEIKALLQYPGVKAVIDPQSLRDTFSYWSPQQRSIFKGIQELPPGHTLTLQDGKINIQSYWNPDFTPGQPAHSAGEYFEELESLLIDATRIRLRADVPVGAYLSGGLDSSLTTAIIRAYTQNRLDTFSIAFSDPGFDESGYQQKMAEHLGTDHHIITCNYQDIGQSLPDVIWHTETPILRTAPVPMFLLSKLVREHNFKVVMTGEGADEFLAGYDIFKEMKVRRFWAKDPSSELRFKLLFKLYPDINRMNASGAFLVAFFKRGLMETSSPYYSHLTRWTNTARTWRFLSDQSGGSEVVPSMTLPEGFSSWPVLSQAQYLEITTFLSPYLLSSQGDRMAMAHSVEGRYPFLDYRVMEFCSRLPSDMKMPVLIEKWLLKQLGKKYLPDSIWQRLKRPYRAPIHRSFFTPKPLDYVAELLSEEAVRSAGLFEVKAVQMLVQKVMNGIALSETEDMALVGILSAQLVDLQFVRNGWQQPAPVSTGLTKKIDRRMKTHSSL